MKTPLGIWVIAASPLVLAIYAWGRALDHWGVVIGFEGDAYPAVNFQSICLVAAYTTSCVVSAAGLIRGNRFARWAALVTLAVFFAGSALLALGQVSYFHEASTGVFSVVLRSYAVGFSVLGILAFSSSCWYLFGSRTRAFFAAESHAKTAHV